MGRLLTTKGHRVTFAGDGEEFLKTMQVQVQMQAMQVQVQVQAMEQETERTGTHLGQ